MWMEKLAGGVLCVLTPLGPRYIQPSFLQRVYLLWIFRHFQVLPPQVLSPRQQRLLDALCNQRGFVSMLRNGLSDAPILGTLERRPVIEVEALPPRRPSGRVVEAVTRLVEGGQQRSEVP